MPRFSANLGFLWRDRALPDAIRAAQVAGFDAVECHWPYGTDPLHIAEALSETGLPMLGLNTSRGPDGAFGLGALPGHRAQARAAVKEAMQYAARIGAEAIHVMAGIAKGSAAQAAFRDTLSYACDLAAPSGTTVLIEALNPYDVPGYFLSSTAQGADLIADIGAPNLKLMFDCYHVGRSEGPVLARLREVWPLVGHIQFARVPDRGPPIGGEVDFEELFAQIDAMGWTRPLGAEYVVTGDTGASLGWMAPYAVKAS